MNNFFFYFFLYLFLFNIVSCSKEVDEMFKEKKEKKINTLKDYTKIIDYQLTQLDNSKKKYDTLADTALILNSGKQEFIFTNIHVLFYRNKKTNTIKSKSAKMDEDKNLFFYNKVKGNFKTEKKSFRSQYLRYARNNNRFYFKTNVVFIQKKNKIYGENFVWDKDKKSFSSKSKIKIITDNGDTIKGEYFYSDDEFKNLEIFNGTGTTEIDDFDEDSETTESNNSPNKF